MGGCLKALAWTKTACDSAIFRAGQPEFPLNLGGASTQMTSVPPTEEAILEIRMKGMAFGQQRQPLQSQRPLLRGSLHFEPDILPTSLKARI
ncbi:unnamed protein product [Taenia asiatica]|uniref:Uncharacterized protein n=1 Tax=Taenia asiatica TaxID=60517 RepID=A0A0R3WG25_TAEAS|nr:unnamed protein product [Taenia asiatica]